MHQMTGSNHWVKSLGQTAVAGCRGLVMSSSDGGTPSTFTSSPSISTDTRDPAIGIPSTFSLFMPSGSMGASQVFP